MGGTMAACGADSASGSSEESDMLEDNSAEELKDAVKAGDRVRVSALLQKRACVNQTYAAGLTPLHLAVVHERIDVITELMEAGADPLAETTDEAKLSPLQIAHAEGNQQVFDALCKEPLPENPWRRRLLGPCVLLLVLIVNIGIYLFVTHPGQPLERAAWCRSQVIVLAGVCASCLLLVFVLDPGTVRREEVDWIAQLRALPAERLHLQPAKTPADEEAFSLVDLDDPEQLEALETYRWCRACRFWRPPGVSHCAECRKCHWRMDHHCWAIGNCVAMRNHRFFTTMLVSGLVAWALSVWSILLGLTQVFTAETWWPLDGENLPLYFAVLMVVMSVLPLVILVPFTGFHILALLCNVTSKSTCGARAAQAEPRRLLGPGELKEVLCMPIELKPCAVDNPSSSVRALYQ